MNEQERGMIEGLFQRLQQAETQSGPRDHDAEALIGNLMARQPSAPYLLAQVVLVQEQGLRNLQTRVEELERQRAERPQDSGGFLGGLFGGGQPEPDPQPAMRKSSGWSNNKLPTRGTAAMQQPGTSQAAQGSGFMAGAMQTALGVGGGVLLANAVSGLFADEAEAAEPEAAAPSEEPDTHAAEEEGGLFDDFFGGGEDDEY